MKPPRFLVGTCLVFWGGFSSFLIPAIVMACVIEAARFSNCRWELTDKEMHRFGDLCTIIFLLITVHYYTSNQDLMMIFALLQWLPVILYPLLLAQSYSNADSVPLSSLFYTFRKQTKNKAKIKRSNLGYVFITSCLLAAAIANTPGPWFYLMVCLLVTWALWPLRPSHIHLPTWLILIASISLLGFAGHLQLRQLHDNVDTWFVELWMEYFGADTDPYRSRTSIGQLGELKLGNQIVFRVESPYSGDLLLRDASYNHFGSSTWFSRDTVFTEVKSAAGEIKSWPLANSTSANQSMVVAKKLKRGSGTLPLPLGTTAISNLPVQEVKISPLGTVVVKDGPGFIRYQIDYDPAISIDSPPDQQDLVVPNTYHQELTGIVDKLQLSKKSPEMALTAINRYFFINYRYSMYQSAEKVRGNALKNFLRTDRSGHCEFFATATVLLLRKAGIPARYATGYSVQEYSEWEQRYLVRNQHAHAWTLVYINGVWKNFDTTPPIWFETEAQTASFWQPLSDLFSWGFYAFTRWRWSNQKSEAADYLYWMLMILVPIMIWKVIFKKRLANRRNKLKSKMIKQHFIANGEDSEFYQILHKLNNDGMIRRSYEPIIQWLQRIKTAPENQLDMELVNPIITLHYRYRFDPKGLSAKDRDQLSSLVKTWFEKHV